MKGWFVCPDCGFEATTAEVDRASTGGYLDRCPLCGFESTRYTVDVHELIEACGGADGALRFVRSTRGVLTT
jgi:uncharacterized Zn finger protein